MKKMFGHMGDGHPGADPSVMHARFSSMPLHDPGLFTIRRLDAATSPAGHPSPPIRTGIHCFVFVESGETLVTIGDQNYLFMANECAVIPAGQVFSVRYWRDCSGYMGGFHTDFLNVDCGGRNILRSFPFLRTWGGHKVRFGESEAFFVTNILRRLETEKVGTGKEDVLKTYLTALLVEIGQVCTTEQEPDLGNKLCNDFVEYIFENPSANRSLMFHAERLHVSPAHLTRTVRELTGKTPTAWMNDAVILEAKVLLCHSDLPVGEIAARVGHEDPSYFSRLFRKSVGMTPLEYRMGSKKS